MNYTEKLRTLADWFSGYDFSSKAFLSHNEVQKNLRDTATEFERLKSELLHRDVNVIPEKDAEYERLKKCMALDIAVRESRIDEQNILIDQQYNEIKKLKDVISKMYPSDQEIINEAQLRYPEIGGERRNEFGILESHVFNNCFRAGAKWVILRNIYKL